jgi:predicted RNA methylase
MRDKLDVFGHRRGTLYDPPLTETPFTRTPVGVLARKLRARDCPSDRAFDEHLPEELRVVSGMYWTPLVVAVRVAEWLDELAVGTLVDVGSGVGKLCVAAALAGRARYVGIEQRGRLVEVARDLARTFELEDRVSFVEGALGETPVPAGDAYYLYNPFGENRYDPAGRLDSDVELSEQRYRRDVVSAEKLMADAPVGTFVVTYNGFGGAVPSAYREVRVDHELPNVLRMFEKRSFG